MPTLVRGADRVGDTPVNGQLRLPKQQSALSVIQPDKRLASSYVLTLIVSE